MPDIDQIIFRFGHTLLVHKELFIKLFSRTEACIYDFYILIRFVSRQTDEVPCHVIDTDRLAHIQDEDFSAFGEIAGLKNKGHRFRDRHEITDDIRIRDSHRTAGLDLFFKERDHTSVGSQDISKPYCHKYCVRIFSGHHLDDHFAYPLGGPHKACGVDRLICGDQKKSLYPSPGSCRGQLIGAHDIVLDSFIRAGLHKRHMLMGRRMVDHIRMILLQYAVYPVGVPDRSDQSHQIQIRILPLQFHLQIVCIVFIDIKDDQLLRASRCNLPAKLRPDGPSASGDHDDFSMNGFHDFARIDSDLISFQKLIRTDVTKSCGIYLAGDDLHQSGHGLDTLSRLSANVQDLLTVLDRRRRNGKYDQINFILVYKFFDIIPVAFNPDPFQIPSMGGRIVIHYGPYPEFLFALQIL